MRYYYIPLCAKDFTFENIFASESISPHNFYKRRGFGIDYFFKIGGYHNDTTLILFNKPPLFQLDKEDKDSIKFFLAIDESAIDLNEIIIIDSEIIGYQKTIYLNQLNFKIVCFSEVEKRTLILRSESSLPTKDLKKFETNFEIISENECFNFDISPVSRLNVINEKLDEEIIFDRNYNSFKGYIYGVSVGQLNGKTDEELKLKNSLKEITNLFAELKNRNEENSFKENYSRFYSKTSINYDAKLRHNISDSLDLFLELFPEYLLSEHTIAKFLFSEIKRFKLLEDALKFVDFTILGDELFGSDNYNKLKSKFIQKNKSENPQVYYDILFQQLDYFKFNNESKNKSAKESANDNFKNALFKLSKFIDEKFIKNTLSKNINLDSFNYSLANNKVTISSGYLGLNDKLTEELNRVSNIILKHSKVGRRETPKEAILKIVESVGSEFSKKGGDSSQLFKYLNNEISSYSLDKVSSTVMLNFVAFVFNPDSIEKLTNYIENKQIQNEWIAYAFWCGFNGFANVSKNFLKPIFDTDNHNLQQYLDNYLLKILDSENREFILNEPKFEYSEDKINIKLKEFFEKYIQPKYSITEDEFLKTFKVESEVDTINALKNTFKIPKKDGKYLIKSFKEFISSSSLF